jgi:hypothetical protein
MNDSKTSNFKVGAKSQPKQAKATETILEQSNRVQEASVAFLKAVTTESPREQLLASLRLASSYINEGSEEKVLKVAFYSLMQILEINGYVRSEDHDMQFNLINKLVSDILQN